MGQLPDKGDARELVEPKVAFNLSGELLDDVLDGILVLDESGCVVYANSFAHSKLWDSSVREEKLFELKRIA